jgi:flagellar hook-basal body complex protein FliE
MPGPILPISTAVVPNLIPSAGTASASSAAAGGFKDAFAAAIQSVEGTSHEAAASVERFLSGEGEELHTTIMATQRAELAFEMFLQARNKVVSAYQEIMRLQM